MPDVGHRVVEVSGLRMHLAELGRGPLVLLCHGFPECWYSWRHQLRALAAAGYRAVAPDQRGYAETDAPAAIDQYTILHLVGDLVGLLDALGAETAAIVGHDWGATVAWQAALIRPDRFPAVAALSIPFPQRGAARPLEAARRAVGDRFFYWLYFQEPGVAEAELERDVRTTMRWLLYALSGDAPPAAQWQPVQPDTRRGLLDTLTDPPTLPAWLTEADLDVYTVAFQRAGFRGGLNWYRNIDRNWELTAAYHGATVQPPALFLIGDRDRVLDIPGMRARLERLPASVPNLRQNLVFPGAGHWIQQERPAEVNAALLEFLRSAYPPAT